MINATDPIVNLIVNPAGNSVYTVGDYCGNTTLTCNSISDAVAYFNSIENNQYPTSNKSHSWIYQQLNLQLTDGIYGVSESSFNAFEFNLTISPLTVGSTNVIFYGTKDVTSNPLFSVITPAGIDDNTRLTYITITGISFNNFSQPILQVSTNLAYTSVTFISCNMEAFNGSITNSPLIDVNGNVQVELDTTATSWVNFTNCDIRYSTMNEDTSLISSSNAVILLNSVSIVSSTNVKSAVSASYGFITITGSTFSSISSSSGVLNAFNSFIDAYYSIFNNNNVSTNGAVLSYTTTIADTYIYRFTNCSLSQNIATLNGGAVYSVSTGNAVTFSDSQIINSTVSDNYAGENGGAIYSDGVPLLMMYCSVSQNSAPLNGGTFYLTNTDSLRVDSSTLLQSTSLQSQNGGLVYSYASSLTITNTYFVNNPINAFVCNASSMIFQFDENLTDSFVCVNCNSQESNVCQTSVTTTTTTTTTSTTSGHHGDGSFATINYQISNLLLLISFTLFLIFVL